MHFAPSNIPVLFAFSMAAGLLAGNACAVRLPSAETRQADVICRAVNSVCETSYFKNRIAIFRCGHDRDIIDALSEICDVRVIWGGDASVGEIRKSPLRPLATELPFADRKSAAVIDAEYLLGLDGLEDVFRAFYNDTYLNDQNACSSPRIVYWVGGADSVKVAKERFWSGFGTYLKGKYTLQAATAMNKATAAAVLAAVLPDAEIKKNENLIVRVETGSLSPEIWDMTVPGGFFVESSGESVCGLLPVLGKVCQTVCCLGGVKDELLHAVINAGVRGCDRIVDFGASLDFGLVWDGHDLIEAMSRKIVI